MSRTLAVYPNESSNGNFMLFEMTRLHSRYRRELITFNFDVFGGAAILDSVRINRRIKISYEYSYQRITSDLFFQQLATQQFSWLDFVTIVQVIRAYNNYKVVVHTDTETGSITAPFDLAQISLVQLLNSIAVKLGLPPTCKVHTYPE